LISLKGIARLCGVSEATVSMALRDKPGVNPLTRDRVVSVAEKYNYRPNALVRSIQSSRTMTVGVACNSFEVEFPAKVVSGILEVMNANGYEVFMINWNSEVREGGHVFRSMGERRVDGILMYPPPGVDSRTYLQEMGTFHSPLVLVDQTLPGWDYDYVGSDDFAGAFKLMEHVIQLGHRRIGIVCPSGGTRYEGFREAMLRYGAAIRPEWALNQNDIGDDEIRRAGIRRILKGSDRPTVILCYNDLVALEVYGLAGEMGLKIPTDLSVSGFGNLWVSRTVFPKITTVHQNGLELGRRAGQVLLERMTQRVKGEEVRPVEPKKILLPTELIIRGSTCSPSVASK
jgi:DNA-binding LacI/PurR family transcriptional regulator